MSTLCLVMLSAFSQDKKDGVQQPATPFSPTSNSKSKKKKIQWDKQMKAFQTTFAAAITHYTKLFQLGMQNPHPEC